MEKVIGVILGLAFVAALLYGWVWLVTLAVNYILAALGMKQVGMFFVWVCMFLLGVLGSYFRTQKVVVDRG